MYTALKNPRERRDDNHVYSHLNGVQNDYVNHEEIGIQESLCPKESLVPNAILLQPQI